MSSPRDLEIINGNTNRGIERVIALLGTGENGDENALSGAIIPAQLLNDYKLYGVDSFVYNTPALWEMLLLHPYTANDRWANGDALGYVLTTPEKLALPAWLGMLSDTKAQADLFAGLTTAALLAGNSAAMTALAASETAMYALTGSETMWAAVVASETAMAAVAGSETAMRIVCGDAVAMQAVVASETAMAVFRTLAKDQTEWAAAVSDTMAAKLCAVLAGSDAYASISGSANLIANTAVFQQVLQSEEALGLLAKSRPVLATITTSETAMEAVETSDAAKAALAASPLKTSAVYACPRSILTDCNTDKLYLISMQQSEANSANYIYMRTTARDNSMISVKASDCYNKEYACARFMSKLSNYTNHTAAMDVTYTYIPLS